MFLNQRGSFEWLSDSDESLSQWGKEAFMSGSAVSLQSGHKHLSSLSQPEVSHRHRQNTEPQS